MDIYFYNVWTVDIEEWYIRDDIIQMHKFFIFYKTPCPELSSWVAFLFFVHEKKISHNIPNKFTTKNLNRRGTYQKLTNCTGGQNIKPPIITFVIFFLTSLILPLIEKVSRYSKVNNTIEVTVRPYTFRSTTTLVMVCWSLDIWCFF